MAKPTQLTVDQVYGVLAELQAQTDRGAAIIAASVLDEMLEVLLLKRLCPLSNKHYEALFNRMAPLSSFSAKIEMAFALGLLSENGCGQLHTIRDVRNKFAHRIEALSFDHPDIQEELKKAASRSPALAIKSREGFLIQFRIIALLLAAETRDDIQIKQLGETHEELFLDLATQVRNIKQPGSETNPLPPGAPWLEKP